MTKTNQKKQMSKSKKKLVNINKTSSEKDKYQKNTTDDMSTEDSIQEQNNIDNSDIMSISSEETRKNDNRTPTRKPRGKMPTNSDNDNIELIKNTSYLNVSIKVRPSTNGIIELASRMCVILKIFKDADETVKLLPYAPHTSEYSFGGQTSIDKKAVINKDEDMPVSLMLLKKYIGVITI